MTESALLDRSARIPELGRSARGPERQHRAGCVLLAEDDTEMRRLLASALRSDGYDVIETADGKELLSRLSDSVANGHPIDFVVTDVRMPKLTGIQALMLIQGAGLQMPVIVITAFGDHSTHIDAWLLGAAAVMDKPFDIKDLLTVMHKLEADSN